MRKKAKKVTLNNLSDKVDKLAATVEVGFKQVNSKMDSGFAKAEENRESLARMISGGFKDVMGRIGKLDVGQAKLEQGQENIQLRLDSMAPQFEVKQLERRVKRLEDRAGIRHAIQH